MKIRMSFAMLLLAGAAFALPATALADGPDIFRAQKCTSCHSVTAAKIDRDADSTEDGKDLSTVGARHDKRAIAKYLLKQETLGGEKHKKAFQGSTEDLKAIATWLESLKK